MSLASPKIGRQILYHCGKAQLQWNLNLTEDKEEEEGKEIPQAKSIKLFGYIVLRFA